MARRLSRKQLLGAAGATGGGIVLGAAGIVSARDDSGAAVADAVPFYGRHQAGVTTPQQKYLRFAAFDLDVDDAGGLRELLRAWTHTAAHLTSGRPAAADAHDPARLTVTIGLGPSVFADRLGLAAQLPEALVDIPRFHGDDLDPAHSDGDLGVQCCSTSVEAASRAVHALAAAVAGAAHVRWEQPGFIRDPLPGEAGGTPRNIIGFKDGTNNLHPGDAARMRTNVWVNAGDGPAWMTDGTYVVCRRILARVENFLPEAIEDQQHAIGRVKVSGAPFGQKREFDPVIPSQEPADSHIMVANPRRPGSEAERILRRGYTYTDGYDARLSSSLGGLFFIAFQRDPRRQFIPIQRRLSVGDRLGEYIVHQTSAVFAVPPGARAGGYVGDTLLGA